MLILYIFIKEMYRFLCECMSVNKIEYITRVTQSNYNIKAHKSFDNQSRSCFEALTGVFSAMINGQNL